MGAGSSTEPPAPQDGDGAAAGSPGTPPELLPAEEAAAPQPPAEPAKVLDASLPVPDAKEDSLERDAPPQEPQQPGAATAPQDLDGQQSEVASPLPEPPGEQAEAAGTNVGQTEHSSVTLKEEAETMETSPSAASTKDGVDAEKDDDEDADTVKQLPSLEEDAENLDEASEPQSYDLGFKKVFKFVGFRFTVKKEKTGKSEPVQLLTVKKETQVLEGAGDEKEVSSEETAMPEDAHCAEDNTKDTLKNELTEHESPKTPETNEICSESAALATDTASPLRRFFTQGWSAFRKKKSFRKPKEDELQSPTQEEEQEKEGSTLTTETSKKEEKSEFEKQDEEKNMTGVTTEVHEKEQTDGEKQESEKTLAAIGAEACEKEELIRHNETGQKEDVAAAVAKESAMEKKAEEGGQEGNLVEVSEDLCQKEEKTEEGGKESEVTEKPLKTKSVVPVITDSVNRELKTFSEVLPAGEKLESSGVKCETEDRNEVASEEKPEAGSLAIDISSEQLKKSEEGEGNKPSPLGKETCDEKAEEAELKISPTSEDITGKLDTQGKAQDRTTEKKASKEHETKLTLDAPGLKSFSTSECSVDTEDDQQTIKPSDEGLQGKTGIVLTDTVKPDEITTEITPEEAAGKRPPEGIINEAELLSSQEKTRPQGSPLKKLFTGTGLKKLSGKKQKGKREESKLGEQGEPIQHLSDSPDSPEEQKGESSASSPEEMNEIPSLEKSADGMQVTENEEAATSDVERKRESVTAWASFKKMVTPKKRVRRPSESDKEEEIDKTKDAAVSATENAVDEKQGEFKENGMDQKQEKATEEPKRKVDTSVSWEAFICVGSSKKRARRKSSSSDEETEHKLAQESQKVEEPGQTKETVTDAILTSSQESDQGQGNSSPEQAGSPSEGEGISTWESFKRLVTPRRKSKTRMEERTEDSVVGSSLEHSTSDGEPGKDESWVPFRKLMPRRRKKKSDGKPEPNNLKQTREDMAETAEEDSDIPAVVPLSEYEAAEQEKMEAQQTKDAEVMRERTSEEERAGKLEESLRIEQGHEGLVHVVTVTVVEGERAVSSIEERSPSWISAALTECIEQAKEEEEKETERTYESDVLVEEAVVAAKTEPEMRKDQSDDTTASELELTSEAVTALEETAEASCAEGTMEVSLAEETTEMVSAVSQLLETPDTTEEVTPVQEVEATEQNLKELDKQTQKVLQEVAERVKSADAAQLVSERTMTTTVITTVEGIESEVKDDAKDGQVVGQATVLLDQSLKTEEHKDDLQALGSAGSIQDQTGLEGSVLPEASERIELSASTKESTEGCENVDVSRDESQCQTCEEPVVEDHEEISEAQRTVEEPSSEDRDPQTVKAVTPEEEPFPKQEASEQEKLPVTDFAVDETRDACIPEVHTAVQDKMEDETSTLGLPLEEPVQLEGQDKTLMMGPECTEAAVTVVPMKPERQDEIPDLDSQEQTCTKGVPGKAPAQIEEKEDDTVLLGEESTEVAVTEVPLQNEVKTFALPSETTGSEAAADAEQNGRDGDGRQITAKDPVPFVEPQCREKTTEIPSQSDETEGGKMEDAVPKPETHLERGTPVTEAPMQIEADSVSNVSTCPDLPENGSTILTDTIPKKCETLSSLAEEETVEKEEKLLETSTCQDFQEEDNKNEHLMERAKEVFEFRKGEAVRGAECSRDVQQEVLTVQEEGSDSTFPQAKSLEALTVPVPVAAAADEEHIMAETVTPADTTSETVQPLATTAEQMASEGVLVAAVDFSGCGTAELGSAGTPEPQVSPTSMNGLLEEQERPQSTEQPKQNGIPLIHSLSLTHMEFEKDIVQSVSIESQSTKIVSNAIETAVHKLAETEKPAAFEPEQCIKSTGKSPSDTPELLESTQVDHQLPEGKEEIWNNGQELQQSQIVKTATIAESAETHAPVEKTKDMLLTSEVLEDGPNQNSLIIMTSPEDISRASEGLQKSTLELSTSENLTKDPIDIHPPELREKEVGWIMEITDKHTGQQMCRESKEEQHPLPVEDGKKQKWEDDNCQEATSCDSPQSQNSVAPEALNMC